jgi:hypothetical protein
VVRAWRRWPWQFRSWSFEDFAGAIGGGVVDENDFFGEAASISGLDAVDDFFDGLHFVEDWNKDGNRFEGVGHAREYKESRRGNN